MAVCSGVKLQALTNSDLHSSIPLVIPDDMQYDFQSNTVRKLPGKGNMINYCYSISHIRCSKTEFEAC